jgi:hypothetical protein
MCYGSILSSKLQEARKKHICNLCDRPINPGRVYEKTVYSDEGELGTQRTCSRCRVALDLATSKEDLDDGDGCLFSGWRDTAKEVIKGTPLKELLQKARKALAPWRAKRAKRSTPATPMEELPPPTEIRQE